MARKRTPGAKQQQAVKAAAAARPQRTVVASAMGVRKETGRQDRLRLAVALALLLGVAAVLFVLNFLADKIPYVDSLNDLLHTVVRVPAGALLAYGAAGQLGPEASVIAALLGGTLAAGSHIAKTGTRALINASPEPLSNVAASFATDGIVVGGLMLAITHPITFLLLLALFVVLVVWLLMRLWRLAPFFRRRAR